MELGTSVGYHHEIYYGMADREPHADALHFRGEEWLEDAVGQLRVDSGPES